MMQQSFEWWRCPKCGGKLAKLALAPGSTLEIKCSRCNTLASKHVSALATA
jgi:phage FluMu protein Com